MRIAIVSDIHSNLEALEVVLADAARKRVQKIYCLGDIVGYGPDPTQILDAARCFDFVIMGNHDEAVGDRTPHLFKPLAARAVMWTRRKLRPNRAAKDEQRARWRFLRKKLRRRVKVGDMLFAHGTPTSNLEYIYEPEEARQVFVHEMPPSVRMCFVGHTHIPGCFTWSDDGVDYIPGEPDKRYVIKGKKALINVGSVGQPRDGDPRACYVLLRDDGSFAFRRVPYSVERTVEKIYATKGLDQSLGDRLLVGE
jgi:predicted phosphodiesterase